MVKWQRIMPNDRLNRAKHVPLSDDWPQFLSVTRKKLTCDPQSPRAGTPYNGLYGEAPPERDTFFKLQVYERVGISLVEVYERVGKSVIWLFKRLSA